MNGTVRLTSTHQSKPASGIADEATCPGATGARPEAISSHPGPNGTALRGASVNCTIEARPPGSQRPRGDHLFVAVSEDVAFGHGGCYALTRPQMFGGRAERASLSLMRAWQDRRPLSPLFGIKSVTAAIAKRARLMVHKVGYPKDSETGSKRAATPVGPAVKRTAPSWKWTFKDGQSLYAWLDKHGNDDVVKLQRHPPAPEPPPPEDSPQTLFFCLDDEGPEAVHSLAAFIDAMRRVASSRKTSRQKP